MHRGRKTLGPLVGAGVGEGSNLLVSAVVLARCLGVSGKTVAQLAKAGTVERAGRGYDLERSVNRYCAKLRETASARGGEDTLAAIRAERTRLLKGQADAVALKTASAAGELVWAADC